MYGYMVLNFSELAHYFILYPLYCLYLNKSSEWSQTSAGSYHDDRCAWSVGQSELRSPDKHWHPGIHLVTCVTVICVARCLVTEPGGGHTLVSSASARVVLHHHTTDVDTCGMNLKV